MSVGDGESADHVLANRVSWDADPTAGSIAGGSRGPRKRSPGASEVRPSSSSGCSPGSAGWTRSSSAAAQATCRRGFHVAAPEAARILRPDGELVFLGHSYLAMLTFPDEDQPASEQLQRDHFGMHRFDWPDAEGAVEFALTHGDMIRLLRTAGFELEDLVEVRAPEGAETPTDPLATAVWSRRWPIGEVWKARKTR